MLATRSLSCFLVAVVASLAWTDAARAGGSATTYNVSGSVQGKGTAPISGGVSLGTNNALFLACFHVDVPGFGDAAPGVCDQSFNGTKQELDLLFISFWSVEDNFTDATGSGIRLLFGLFVIGTMDNGPTRWSFSGVIDSEAADRGAASAGGHGPEELLEHREDPVLLAVAAGRKDALDLAAVDAERVEHLDVAGEPEAALVAHEALERDREAQLARARRRARAAALEEGAQQPLPALVRQLQPVR